jgi:hypothetical protein
MLTPLTVTTGYYPRLRRGNFNDQQQQAVESGSQALRKQVKCFAAAEGDPVIMFGLSMDYHVFILSRMREAHDRRMSTEDAVAHGIKATASVVTSAAIVIVAVFAIFATLDQIDFKMVGVGLAAAILIDATIVRAVLVPAVMKLLGDWNWYLPSRLEWLPHLGTEPTAGSAPSLGTVPSPRPATRPRQPARPARRHLSFHKR